jgi:hypothetical protein
MKVISEPTDLAGRVFENTKFQIAWVLWLGLFFVYVGIPLQRFLVVCWVRGADEYFNHHIRVLPGKPDKFSDGQPVPSLPDAVTGFVVFMVVALGLSLLMFHALRFCERHFRSRQAR